LKVLIPLLTLVRTEKYLTHSNPLFEELTLVKALAEYQVNLKKNHSRLNLVSSSSTVAEHLMYDHEIKGSNPTDETVEIKMALKSLMHSSNLFE
jgi:hypothetical protein